jgi:hypothetical protein
MKAKNAKKKLIKEYPVRWDPIVARLEEYKLRT